MISMATAIWRSDLVRINDNSMSPTLESGRIVRIKKVHSKMGNKLKGNIIVFYFPYGLYENDIILDKRNIYIKRCTGCPGDTVTPSAINREKKLQTRPSLKIDDLICKGHVIVPYMGMSIPINDSTLALYGKIIKYETAKKDTNILYIDGTYTFSENYYFAIGDNIGISYDSRHWGFIPESFIIGYKK